MSSIIQKLNVTDFKLLVFSLSQESRGLCVDHILLRVTTDSYLSIDGKIND